ncbi:MAG: deoxyribose-phosphate aldolase [Candidatus Bathyarchaeia archaeon]
MLDHSVLRPDSTEEDVKNGCKLAVDLGLAAVVVNPAHVPIAATSLKGSRVKTCSVVSFPFGLSTKEVKLAETRNVLALGAEEIDMVMNYSALRSGQEAYVLAEIKGVMEMAKTYPKKITVKLILETCYLNENEKKKACLLAVGGGVDFVKTSTGFGPTGATIDDVHLMRRTVGSRVGVKAAGGIRTMEQALGMVEAGADRIGTSSSLSILNAMAL